MTHVFEGVIEHYVKTQDNSYILNEGVSKGIVHDGWEGKTSGGRVGCNQLASIEDFLKG